MELHILYLLFLTALSFTVIAYYAKNNWSFAIIAGVAWIIFSMSLADVTYIGFDYTGTGHTYSVQMGDPSTEGLVGASYLYSGIGLVMLILTGGWVLMGREVGDEV
jgi:hypothetical protein